MRAFSPLRGFFSSVSFLRCLNESSRYCMNSDVRWLRNSIQQPIRKKVPLDAWYIPHKSIHEAHQQPYVASQNLQPSNIQIPGVRMDPLPDPFILAKDDVKDVFTGIAKQLKTDNVDLCDISKYYFDWHGKALVPTAITLMAKAVNYHIYGHKSILSTKQRQVAMITEMLQTAGLYHDDVIDAADTRLGKPSAIVAWNPKKSVLAGDFIFSIAAGITASLDNTDVTITMSQMVAVMVEGELIQRGSTEDENERFQNYLLKSFKKFGSITAHGCKGVSILAGAHSLLQELAFQYGRNLGIAYQLVDDILDFVATASTIGKQTRADLRTGIATAPVLFACEKYPELNSMIIRRFSEPGDVDRAHEAVLKSDGIEQTRYLAYKHLVEAVRLIQQLADSPERRALVALTDCVLASSKTV